jgi:hypothetical protein
VALWSSLAGRTPAEQAAILRLSRASDEDLWVMEDEASIVRAASPHAEWPSGGIVRCRVCAELDTSRPADLYWHPWAAPMASFVAAT